MVQRKTDRYHLTIAVRKASNASILDLTGPLGTGGSLQLFRDHVNELLNAGTKNIAINLGKVPYVDSSGIGVLVGAHTSVEAAGGKCKFFAPLPRVMQVLKMVRVDEVLKIFGDEDSALSSF